MTDSTITSWVSRLERRMSKLADTASKESIQALAKWIGFRRKHAKEFAKVLADAIMDPSKLPSASTTVGTNNTVARQWLYLQIVHESIILDSGTSRWDRLAEMREILGEFCMEPVAKSGFLDAATIKKVEGFVKQWDTLNVFGGPTLVNVIKKQLSSSPQPPASSSPKDSKKASAEKSISPSTSKDTATDKPTSPKDEKMEAEQPKATSPKSPKSPKREPEDLPQAAMESMDTDKAADETPNQKAAPKSESSAAKTPKKEVEYDFESKNIPYGKVDSRNFLAPCKAIATLQIARDLRNDSAVQLSSLLKALPDDVKALCDEADKETRELGTPFQLPEDKARDLSMRTSEKLLDMDLEDQLQNVRTFTEIIEKQREARQRLIYLLIRSRCRFGADEAAGAFYKLDEMESELKKRKETLLDAMALEGLDFEETKEESGNKDKAKEQVVLAPLTWYKREEENNDEEPAAKRAKLEDEK